ncbi:polynucleotide adenylyltransferase [Linnemannia elongata]|nr:polynucleotide adenylyltransferase [Linnemannia elongata]
MNNQNGAQRRLGVTMPISEAFPTKEDLESSDRLLQTLKDEGLEIVLGKLDKLVKEFVYLVYVRKGYPEQIAKEAGGKIFTFGSYRLGVHGSGTDIDTLCVVPRYVDREDFFQVMHDLLRRRPEVTELTSVPDAFTPVITMSFSDIPRRAVYSNMMGFLGGVAWAMLVARVCQLYPNACAATIISRFFSILHQWPWPQPVLLKPIEEGPLQVRVWNPKLYQADKAHKMPIITPAYPSMCATHNVTDSTKAVMLSEFKDAAELVNRIMTQRVPWSTLFAKDDFFTRYRHYLQVIASSDSEERHLTWSGLVESRLRHLVAKLERIDNLVLAHPYIKGYSKVIKYKTAQEKEDAAHGIINAQAQEAAEGAADSADVQTIWISIYYIGLCIPDREDVLPAEAREDAEHKKNKRSKSGKKNAAAVDARPPTKKRRGSAVKNGVASDAASVTSVASVDTPGTPSAIASPIVKSDVSTASTPVLPQA